MAEENTTEAKKATTKKAATPKKTTTRKAPARKTAAKSTSATAKKTATTRAKTATKKTTSSKAATTAKKTTTRKTASASPKAAKPSPPKASKEGKAKAAAESTSKAEQTNQSSAPNTDTFVEDLKDKDWGASIKRGLFMLIFGFVGQFALSVVFFLAFLQFVVSLLMGPPNTTITSAIQTASRYLSEILAYLSFKTDDLPFPFGNDFPSDEDK